jgi:hypothetical protein
VGISGGCHSELPEMSTETEFTGSEYSGSESAKTAPSHPAITTLNVGDRHFTVSADILIRPELQILVLQCCKSSVLQNCKAPINSGLFRRPLRPFPRESPA